MKINENQLVPTIKTYKSFWKILLLTLNLCLSAFYFGYFISYLGVIKFDDIIKNFYIPPETKETIEVVIIVSIPVGAALGSLFSIILIRKFSRRYLSSYHRKSLLSVNCLSIVVGSLILIPRYELLIACRLTQGFCIGIYSVLIPIMIREFVPTEVYGTLSCLFQCLISLGILVSQLLSISIGELKETWRIIFGFPLITTALQTLLLLFVFKFETPKYLLSKGLFGQCEKVLKYLYKQQHIDAIYNQKQQQAHPIKEFLLMQSQISFITHKIQFRRIRILVALHIVILQQFCGINVFSFYLGKFLQPENNILLAIATLQFVGAVLAIFVFSKIGRKKIIQIGTAISTLTLFIIFIDFFEEFNHYLLYVLLGLYYLSFGLTLGPFSRAYIPEILPPEAISWTSFANWIAATIVFGLSSWTTRIHDNGIYYMILFCSMWCVVSLMINEKYVLETKGKSQSSIYIEYDKIK